MKKLILISAILFSFNGWADNHYYTDRAPINLICKPIKVNLCASKDNCESHTAERLMQTNPEVVPAVLGMTLRETTFEKWAMTLDGTIYRATLENNIIKTSTDVPQDNHDMGYFAGKRVSWSVNMISAMLVYEVFYIARSYTEIEWTYQCTKQQSLLE